MQVVVVAITRAPGGLCVGALTRSGKPLRLLEPGGRFVPWNQSPAYVLGQVWDVSYTRPGSLVQPHIEDVYVTSREYVESVANLENFIRGAAVSSIWSGGTSELFDGHLEFTLNGSGYIEGSIPSQSTGFWEPDYDLVLSGNRYLAGNGHVLSYVGTQTAKPRIAAGTLVRVSLARWWRPDDASADFPARCYLQLSGWY